MEQLLMQGSEIGSLQQVIEVKMQTNKVEGFDQVSDQPIPSSQRKLSIIKDQAFDTFYKIPEAKPILSKQIIDFSKPKVLIKEIIIHQEPEQFLSLKSFHSSSNLQHPKLNENRSIQKHHNYSTIISHRKSLSSNEFNQQNLPRQNSQNFNDQMPTTLWQKYLVRSGYECVYLKYLRDSLNEQFFGLKNEENFQRRDQKKKLKLQLLRMCRNNENLFNTYFIDLDFITEAGKSLIKNLQQCNLNDIYNKWMDCKKSSEEIQNQDIEFDSRFQCGNLFSVFRKIDQKTQKPIQPRTFDLILQNDINTKGYTNWFYFSVKSKKKGRLKFNLVNMYKTHSLYNQGMKVCVFSYQNMKNEGIEWMRDGFDYSYRLNQLLKSPEKNERYNTLSFSLHQKYDNDIIFIAANLPYSYSRLLRFIEGVEKTSRLNSNIYLKLSSHMTSISSNSCPLLTLTWKRDKNEKTNYKKKVIAIIGRQHPCQTVGSFVVEGIINSLVHISNESYAQLLKRYIFKIIPMFNVDGVIYGNARCDISGTDVNRKWTKSPNSFLYPIIKASKKLYQELLNENYEIDYFIDLHGHSKKLGTFIYSCKNNDPVESRVFTWLMSKISNKFVLDNCIFSIAKNKNQTARASMAQFVTNKKSLTVETSFFGWKRPNGNSIKHFQIKDLHEIGENLLKAIYADQVRDPKLYNWNSIKNEIKVSLDSNRSPQSQEQSGSGSDSDPQNDEMTLEEKTNSFLPSNTASKIGLIEVKVVQKNMKSFSLPGKREKQPENNQVLEGFRFPINEEPLSQDNRLKSYFSNRLTHNLSEPKIRQSRSVTKILPFKFTQRQRKSLPTKKIRIVVDIKYIEQNKQKMPSPSFLPQIQEKQGQGSNEKIKRKKFWSNFNRQIQSIVKQRENILSNMQIEIINREKLFFGKKSQK